MWYSGRARKVCIFFVIFLHSLEQSASTLHMTASSAFYKTLILRPVYSIGEPKAQQRVALSSLRSTTTFKTGSSCDVSRQSPARRLQLGSPRYAVQPLAWFSVLSSTSARLFHSYLQQYSQSHQIKKTALFIPLHYLQSSLTPLQYYLHPCVKYIPVSHTYVSAVHQSQDTERDAAKAVRLGSSCPVTTCSVEISSASLADVCLYCQEHTLPKKPLPEP